MDSPNTKPQVIPGARPRNYQSWIEGFCKETAHLRSPRLFRQWTAVAVLSAALQRKVYVLSDQMRLHPNVFVFLTSPPGVGKSIALETGRRLLSQLPKVKIAPNKVTPEQFINLMQQARTVDAQVIVDPVANAGGLESHCSYTVFSSELSVFLGHRHIDFHNALTDLYDCLPEFIYDTRHREEERIVKPYLTVLAGTTPQSIFEDIGPSALGKGFLARVVFIYDSHRIISNPWEHAGETSYIGLLQDLEQIYRIKGEFTITDEGKQFAWEWLRQGMPPLPIDTRLADYNSRRFTHLLKLSLIISAARSSERLITLQDIQASRTMLLEAEESMPLVFERFGDNPLARAVKDCHRWMQHVWRMQQKPIQENDVRRKLLVDVHPQYIDLAIDQMLISGFISRYGDSEKPHRLFIPNTVV